MASSVSMLVYRETTSNEIGMFPLRYSWFMALNRLSKSVVLVLLTCAETWRSSGFRSC